MSVPQEKRKKLVTRGCSCDPLATRAEGGKTIFEGGGGEKGGLVMSFEKNREVVSSARGVKKKGVRNIWGTSAEKKIIFPSGQKRVRVKKKKNGVLGRKSLARKNDSGCDRPLGLFLRAYKEREVSRKVRVMGFLSSE